MRMAGVQTSCAMAEQAAKPEDLAAGGADAECSGDLRATGNLYSAIKSDEASFPGDLRTKVTRGTRGNYLQCEDHAEKVPVAIGLRGRLSETPYVKPQDVKIIGADDTIGFGEDVRGISGDSGWARWAISGSGRLQLAQWLASKENRRRRG